MNTSIIIPTYNARKLLEKNLPKVKQAAPKSEIIVVDDASTDDTVKFLKTNFPKVKIVQHKTNKRFAVACNSGVKAASGKIVIMLNNDVIPESNFLSPLLRHFTDKKVFSVGCKEKDNNGNISGRTEGDFQRGFIVHWRPEDQQSQSTFWNFGGSMAIDRDKYLQLGGMDEIFSPAYWEDNDLCWRAKQKGWKILFEKDSVVHHKHETTNDSEFGQRKIEIMSFRNQILFVWKNIRGVQLIKHFFWLPYHLVFTTIRSKGTFLIAFYQAIIRWISYKAIKTI